MKMTWWLKWRNMSIATLNTMLQFLVIYRQIRKEMLTNTFKILINNLFKETFYRKRKKFINVLTNNFFKING